MFTSMTSGCGRLETHVAPCASARGPERQARVLCLTDNGIAVVPGLREVWWDRGPWGAGTLTLGAALLGVASNSTVSASWSLTPALSELDCLQAPVPWARLLA